MTKAQMVKLLKANGFTQSQKHYSGFIVTEYSQMLEVGFYHFRSEKAQAYLAEIRQVIKSSGLNVRANNSTLVISK